MRLASDNPDPKPFHPFCKVCGWRKGGRDSWDGKACKCGHYEPSIEPIPDPVPPGHGPTCWCDTCDVYFRGTP